MMNEELRMKNEEFTALYLFALLFCIVFFILNSSFFINISV